MTRADVYQSVTDRIITALESGTVPWRKPWRGGGPVSIAGRPYRGINVFLLGLMPYGDNRWGTFKAMKAAGGSVRRGEKATYVILWKPVKRANEDGEDTSYMYLRQYAVFNAEQCDGLPEPDTHVLDHTPIEAAEQIVTGYIGPTITVNHVDMAAYSPGLDLVTMPPTASFLSSEGYYSTLFHELLHSTGHKDRLDRLESGGFGTSPYAKEELVAEMGAAMLCGMAGIDNLDQSAGYVDHWLERLQSDPKLVVQAAAQAQKGSDLILGTTFEDSQATENQKELVTT